MKLQVDVPLPMLLAALSVPSKVAPSKNCTLPVDAALPLAAWTIAVKVTESPYLDVFAMELEETEVVVATVAGSMLLIVSTAVMGVPRLPPAPAELRVRLIVSLLSWTLSLVIETVNV